MYEDKQDRTHGNDSKQINYFRHSDSQNSEQNQFSSLEEHKQIEKQDIGSIKLDYPSTASKYEEIIKESNFDKDEKFSHNNQNKQQFREKNEYIMGNIQLFEHPISSDKNFQKQFQQIRFNSIQCNLMDLDIPMHGEQNQQSLKLQGYNYEKFIQNRLVYMDSPQLINQGYITSYKLYQIKTKKGESQAFDTYVGRRFSDFQYLNQLLIQNYGGYIIPNLPEKNFWASMNLEGKQYKQVRTKSLQKYLNRLLKHKKLRLTKEIKNFLFEDDALFSANKGEYTQKKNNIEDKIKTISTGAFEYGKYFYNKVLQFSYGFDKQGSIQDSIKFPSSRSTKLTKQDLSLGQYQLIVGELMRIIKELKILVENTIEEIKRLEELRLLFSFDSQTKSSLLASKSQATTYFSQSISVKIENDSLYQEYEELCQFIQSCSAAILRRNDLKDEISSLSSQQQVCMDRYKNSPRNYELDAIRSKLSRVLKKNQTYTSQLLKQLQIHADEGKGMLKKFISKFERIKVQFLGSGWIE